MLHTPTFTTMSLYGEQVTDHLIIKHNIRRNMRAYIVAIYLCQHIIRSDHLFLMAGAYEL